MKKGIRFVLANLFLFFTALTVFAHHEGQTTAPPPAGAVDSVSSSQTGLIVFIVVALVIGFLAWFRKSNK